MTNKGYLECDTLPAFEQYSGGAVKGELAQWSGEGEPPEVGACVNVRINGIGPAKIERYFIQDGFLGVLATPLQPPEWYVKQNGYNVAMHVFGAEMDADPIPEPVIEGPNQAQLAALQAFATKYGAQWKNKLEAAWAKGSDEREPDGALLRQVRNQYGPEWLRSTGNQVKPQEPKRSAGMGM